jgi:hypothetical protein
MERVNKLSIIAPYLALFGIVATVAVLVLKKPETRTLLFPSVLRIPAHSNEGLLG